MGRYALLVAASDYEDSYFEQLRSPAQDVRGLAAVLEDPAVGGFDVTTLENAADHEVRRMLDELTADREPDDLVLVYFSCHGLQDIHGRLHFATTTTWAQRPASTAIAASFVTERLEHTAAGGRLLMLDCCYSGAFARGFAKTSPRPLDGEISRGYVCLTACNEYELAYEGESVVVDEPRPSVFTEVVIDGLRTGEADLDRDGWIEAGELHRYAFNAVRRANRQTPSYFAAGLQTPLVIARASGMPPARADDRAVAAPGTAMARTPRFFAARFPPFLFAREDRATPTQLAEAMAQRPDEAVALFRSDESRAALYEWISHDVHDRNLERTILRRAPEDAAAAEAAVGTFIATFAPHLPPRHQGNEVSIDYLAGLARRAAEGDIDARASVSQLYDHNVLRTLARHNCGEAAHPCGQGKACAVLLAAAKRWDELVPAIRAALDDLPKRLHPEQPAIIAQLLTMILDATTLKVPYALAAAQHDMPTWWLRLILTARIAAGSPDEHMRTSRLALAVLTHDAARAERDHLREQEGGRRAGPHPGTSPSTPGDPDLAEARGTYLGGLGRLLRATGTAVAAVAVAVTLATLIADYLLGIEFSGRAGTVTAAAAGLVLVSLAAAIFTAAYRLCRRRWDAARRPIAAGALLIGIMVLTIPAAQSRWRDHVHAETIRRAEAQGIALDEDDRPIPSQCRVQHGSDGSGIVLAPTDKVGTDCRAATVYFQGRRTGTFPLPGDTRWTPESRMWVTSSDLAGVLVVAVRQPDALRWRLIAATVGRPGITLWARDLDRVPGAAETLQAIRWGSVVAFAGPDTIYAINLHTGQEMWRRSCPPGRPFDGLGGAHPSGIGMYCGQNEIVVTG